MQNFIISSKQKLKDKIELLQSLADIQIASKMLEDLKADENEFDANYKKLQINMSPLDKDVLFHKIVNRF